jgi:pseudaminic acid cytidylyltransferase
MKRLAIIPARGGSKRIHKKNIKSFCGKPIISYPLEAAKQSGLFDTIHVSTDCLEISNVVEQLGFNIDFMREPSLSDDVTPIMPVLKWVLKKYKSKNIFFDEVALIMACSPLIESSDLQNAQQLKSMYAQSKSVIAVSSYPAPIEWAFNKTNEGLLSPINPGMFKVRSQDLDKTYYDAGAFILFSAESILNSDQSGDDQSLVGYILEKFKGIDIDDDNDWMFAEQLMRAIKFNIK